MEFDFEWDPAKAASNLQKHGVAFEQAASVFLDPLALTVLDYHHSQTEERWFTLGLNQEGGHLLAIAHTFNGAALRAGVRIISARRATPAERRQYHNEPR